MPETEDDFPKVRHMPHCLCGDEKSDGTVLCWRCHRREKAFNGGAYGADTLALLAQLETSGVH